MRSKLSIVYRKFNEHDERRDAGYYWDLGSGKSAKIEVDISEPTEEQVLTLYHEFTHHVLDLLCQYKFEPRKKRITKRKDDIRERWKKNHEKTEEEICARVEEGVQKVLKKELPPEFYKEFFEVKRKKKKVNKK